MGHQPSEAAYPSELGEAERRRLRARRQGAGLPADMEAGGATPAVGLALSGGGIRSATFALGVLQAFAKQDQLRRFDYLSTVSGGGYVGSFLGALFARDKASQETVRETLLPDTKSESRPLGWLRRNGRYLAPNGGDVLAAVASGLRGWAALMIIISVSMLTLFLALLMAQQWLSAAPAAEALELLLPALPGPLPEWPWSPWTRLLLPVALILCLPLGWAYWAVEKPALTAGHPLLGLLLTLGFCGLAMQGQTPAVEKAAAVLGAVAVLALVWLAAAFFHLRRRTGAMPGQSLNEARRRLTAWLAFSLALLGGLAFFALIDTLGLALYRASRQDGGLSLLSTGAVAAGATLLAQRVSALRSLLAVFLGDSKLSLPSGLLIWLIAALAGISILCLIDAAAHAIADQQQVSVQIAFLILLVYCLLFGRAWPFMNRSSHHALYAARLNRSYIGASNPERISDDGVPVTDPLPGDDICAEKYWSEAVTAAGAPLHLVNVTINETVDPRDGTLNRDRKGISLSVGPCALSAGVRHHYLLGSASPRPASIGKDDYWMFEGGNRKPETLSLGSWVAISGAAFTTGTGYHTSLATSLLTGLANVRLGYWWRSDKSIFRRDRVPAKAGRWLSKVLRIVFPVQIHLLDELLANFRGSHEPFWYLSDGGHFENMGAYELIRRRLPVMVVVDGEADPAYQYEGLANLVRKARTDFKAEIDFLSAGELDWLVDDGNLRPALGELSDLVPGSEGYSKAHAAVAKIFYDGSKTPQSLLIYLKPTLKADVPADVREYQQRNPPFPQQPTLDQFFDETQWESYRRLGQHIGERVFTPSPKSPWSPGDLRLPPNLWGR